jgi:hypothetical protein
VTQVLGSFRQSMSEWWADVTWNKMRNTPAEAQKPNLPKMVPVIPKNCGNSERYQCQCNHVALSACINPFRNIHNILHTDLHNKLSHTRTLSFLCTCIHRTVAIIHYWYIL